MHSNHARVKHKIVFNISFFLFLHCAITLNIRERCSGIVCAFILQPAIISCMEIFYCIMASPST